MRHKRLLYPLTLWLALLPATCNLPLNVDIRFQESLTMAQPASIVPAVPGDFTFVHITDPHVSKGTNSSLERLPFNLVASDAFIVDTGDLTNMAAPSDFGAYKILLDNTALPHYSVIGNHDIWNSGWNSYKKVLGPSVYSVTAGDLRIIALDSAEDTIGAAQYAWLKTTLANKTETYCIVLAHYNLFSPLIIETAQSTNMEEVYGMMRLFEQYGVDYVLMGHSHIYDYRQIIGVNYLVGSALIDAFTNDGPKYFNRIRVTGGKMTHQRVVIQ